LAIELTRRLLSAPNRAATAPPALAHLEATTSLARPQAANTPAPAPDPRALTVGAAGASPGQPRPVPLGRGYWGLWAATGVSSLGDGMVILALPLLAASITRDGLALAGVLVAARLPWLLVSLPLGALADRQDRRRMAVTVEVARMTVLLAFGVALAAGLRSLGLVYLVAFGLGALECAFFGATSSAVPDLVPVDGLSRANGHLYAVRNAGEDFLGMVLGGLAFAALAALPFVLDGVSFAASAVLLLIVLPRAASRRAAPRRAAPPRAASRHRTVGDLIASRTRKDSARAADAQSAAPSRPTLRSDVVTGVGYLVGEPALRLLTAVIGGLAFMQAMVTGLMVAYGLGPLHLTHSSYGLVMAVAAVGTVGGGLLAGRIDARLGRAPALVLAALTAGVAYLVLAAAQSATAAVPAIMLEAFGATVGNVISLSMRQRRVPTNLLARTNSAFRMVVYGAVPVGALAGGLIAHAWSVRIAILTAGILQLLVVAATARPILRRLADPVIDLRATPRPGRGAPAIPDPESKAAQS